MVEVFGAGTVVHLSPKDLGLNSGIWDCFHTIRGWILGVVFGWFGTKFRDCFRTVQTKFMDCFWTVRA